MAYVFTVGKHLFELTYEMIDRPVRMRATNAVRRWELLQLQETTEHLFESTVEELRTLLKLEISPEGVAKMAQEYYGEPSGTSVAMGLHHSNPKLHTLSLTKCIRLHSRFHMHSILMEFDIIATDAIKVKMTFYVSNTE